MLDGDDATARNHGFLRIGVLARRSGLSPDTLRHYERVGVLPPAGRSTNGYREYPPRALDRVHLVQRALGCGFTLAELARLLAARDRGETPCRRVRALAERKLAHLEREIAMLLERRDALRRTLQGWNRRLASTPRGRQARLLEHVVIAPASRPARGALRGSGPRVAARSASSR